MNLRQYALAQQLVDQYGARDSSIANVELDSENMLIVTLTDGRIIKAGQIPTVTENTVTQIVTGQINSVKETVNAIETQINNLGLVLNNTSNNLTILDQTINNVETRVDNIGLALENTSKDLAVLQQTAVTQVVMGDTNVTIKDNVLNLPMASGDVIGLVMAKMPSDSAVSVNSISINEGGYLEVGSLSTDKLVQGEYTLILDCSETF